MLIRQADQSLDAHRLASPLERVRDSFAYLEYVGFRTPPPQSSPLLHGRGGKTGCGCLRTTPVFQSCSDGSDSISTEAAFLHCCVVDSGEWKAQRQSFFGNENSATRA